MSAVYSMSQPNPVSHSASTSPSKGMNAIWKGTMNMLYAMTNSITKLQYKASRESGSRRNPLDRSSVSTVRVGAIIRLTRRLMLSRE
eukprot:4035297-Prymnesium_polylepis.1